MAGITPRQGCQSKIDELNNLLECKQPEFQYTFINNENILPSEHLWRDKLHLNDAGLSILANNFISILNDNSFNRWHVD